MSMEFTLSVVRDWEEESLLASYRPGTSEFTFMGVKALRRSCDDRARDIADPSLDCNEYMIFTLVSVEDIVAVDRVWKSLPRMCCLYDVEEQVLIVKLKVGIGHCNLMATFFSIYMFKFYDLGIGNQIRCLRGPRFGDWRRQKEVDESFKPATRLGNDAWPSLVIELGFSESLMQLRNDATFWLT